MTLWPVTDETESIKNAVWNSHMLLPTLQINRADVTGLDSEVVDVPYRAAFIADISEYSQFNPVVTHTNSRRNLMTELVGPQQFRLLTL